LAKKRKAPDGGTLGEVAESLGTMLGKAEAHWRSQRRFMVDSLTAVRDKANELLAELGVVHPPPPPKRGRAARAASAVTGVAAKAVAVVRRARRRKFTPAQKAETSRRMKAYWAARRKEKAK
jgi:hypothetical protein